MAARAFQELIDRAEADPERAARIARERTAALQEIVERTRAEDNEAMNLEALERFRPAIAALCDKYGVAELYVFGSAARGEATSLSDVDLLYVRGPSAARGLAFFGFQEELEDLLGTKVDLVPRDGLHWVIRDRVLADAEALYAA